MSAVPVTVSLPPPVFDAVDRGVRGRLRAEAAKLFGELAPGTRPELRVQAADELGGWTCGSTSQAAPARCRWMPRRRRWPTSRAGPVEPGRPKPGKLYRGFMRAPTGPGPAPCWASSWRCCAAWPWPAGRSGSCRDRRGRPPGRTRRDRRHGHRHRGARVPAAADLDARHPDRFPHGPPATFRRPRRPAARPLRIRRTRHYAGAGSPSRSAGYAPLPRVGLGPGEALIRDSVTVASLSPRRRDAALRPSRPPARHGPVAGDPGVAGWGVSRSWTASATWWRPWSRPCAGAAPDRRRRGGRADAVPARRRGPGAVGGGPALLPMPVLTSVLRGLLANGVGPEPRQIVELLLRPRRWPGWRRCRRCRRRRGEAAGPGPGGLRDQLGAAVAKGAVTLPAHALTPELARSVAAEARPGGTHPPTGATTRLVVAARAERDRNPQVSVIVTQPQHRPAVRDALHPYLPALTVLSLDEVPPQLAVVIAARLS